MMRVISKQFIRNLVYKNPFLTALSLGFVTFLDFYSIFSYYLGNTAACELILEVRGSIEGLQDTDNMKRTPAHLAAICGQGEVVNFLLERGG